MPSAFPAGKELFKLGDGWRSYMEVRPASPGNAFRDRIGIRVYDNK